MKFKLFLVALCFTVTFTNTAMAQADKSQPSKTMPMPAGSVKPASADQNRAALQEKMKAAGMQKGGAPTSGKMDPNAPNPRTMAMNSVSDIPLQKGEKKFTVNGYKLDFLSNPTVDPEAARATITLYTGKDEKIGKINFYADNAKALKEKKALDDKDMANLSYSMDMLKSVQDFLSTSMRSFLVVNVDSKQAYITSDVVPTRTR